jgi:hypothetical protein
VGGTAVGSNLTNASGVATVTYTIKRGVGNHTITAAFAGDTDITSATGNGTLTVTQGTGSIVAVDKTGIYMGTVTFEATLSPALANKTITFLVDDVAVATGTTDANGYATGTYNPITYVVGDHEITASFAGDADITAASDDTATLTVTQATGNVTVSNQNGQVGATVALTATLSPTVAGKTITFYVGGTAVGSDTTDAFGVATVDYTINRSTGTYGISAVFGGDADISAHTGNGTLTVTAAPGTMLLDDLIIRYNGSGELQAHLSPALAGKLITFRVMGVVIGTDTTDANGLATLTGQATVPPGNYTISATWAGDGDIGAASDDATLTVVKADSNLATSNVTLAYGQAGSLTATLKDEFGANISGATVTFRVNGGAALTATTNAFGVATRAYTPNLAPSTYNFTVDFGGNANYNAATQITGQLTVTKADTAITASSVTIGYNQAGSITATLKDQFGANIAGATLIFTVNGGAPQTAPTNASGVATLPYTPNLAAGDYPITVDFAATANYNAAAQATATLTVTKAATTLTTVDQVIQYGAPVTLTATLLSGSSGIQNKTITFKVNNVVVGTGTTNASGVATFTYTPVLAPGSYTINADFATDSWYQAASAPVKTLTVNKASTTLAPNTGLTVVYGQSVNLTGTLTRTDNGATISGKPVEFKVGGTTLAPLMNTNGTGVATYAWTANLPAGTYTFDVGWAGDATYNGASGSTTLTVTKATPTVSVTNQTINYSQTVTLSATLLGAGGLGVASQPITFKLNGVTVGSGTTDSSGIARLIYTPPSAGSYTVTAEFAGNTMYNNASGTGTLTVNKLATVLTLTPATSTITYGGTASFTANLKETVFNTNVVGQSITFSNGATSCTAVTDNAGNATSCLPSPNPGTYTITASFGGTVNYLAAANKTSTLTVNKSNATLQAFDYAIDRQDFTTFTFTGRLTRNSDGAGISGVTVSLTMSGSPTHTCSGVTDANGFVTCSVAKNSVTNGTRTLTPAYTGGYPSTFYNNPTIVTGSVQISNNAVAQTMTLTANPTTVQFTDSVTFTATVTTAVTGQTVNFYQGATLLGSRTTNAGGVATLTVPITDPTTTIVAIADAGTNYTGATATTTITVTKEDVTLAYTGDISLSGPSTPVNLKAQLTQDADGSTTTDLSFGGTVQVQFRVQSISTGVYDNTFTANIDANGLAQTQIYIAQGSYRVTTSMVPNQFLNDPTPVTKDILQAGTGVGLWGQYYIDQIQPYNASFPGPKQWEQLSMSRIDPRVDYTWGTGYPDTQVTQNTNYSVRWTGQVEPFYNENYTFCVQANDGVQLWINGVQRLAASAWNTRTSTAEFCTSPIALTAGSRNDIRLEYWQNTGNAEVHLYWQSTSQPKEIIPSTQLYPVASFTSNLGLRGEYYQSVTANTGSASPTFTYPGTTLKFLRNDGNLSFLWNDNNAVTPGPGMGDEYYLIRWTGNWTPTKNINRICVNSDDGINVWIDGVLRLSVWNLHAPQWDCVNLPSTLAAGSTHSIRIEYYEHTGNSYIAFAGLTTAGATPSAADVIPVGEYTLPSGGQPAMPNVPTVTGIGNYQARLTWNWQNPTTNPMVTSYVIYRDTDPSFTPGNSTMVGTTGPGSSGTPPSFVDSNLISGTTYYYKIVALDSAGNASTATAATAAFTQP